MDDLENTGTETQEPIFDDYVEEPELIPEEPAEPVWNSLLPWLNRATVEALENAPAEVHSESEEDVIDLLLMTEEEKAAYCVPNEDGVTPEACATYEVLETAA